MNLRLAGHRDEERVNSGSFMKFEISGFINRTKTLSPQ